MKATSPGGYQCPSCPTRVQPLESTSVYARRAWEHAQQLELPIPPHGPAALPFLALIAHAMTVHDELDLGAYLEAFLDA